jgi:hypothetical protein
MSSTKLAKAFRKRVVEEGCQVLAGGNDRGHYYYELLHADGQVQHLTMSGSPRIPEHALAAALADVRRFKEGRR